MSKIISAEEIEKLRSIDSPTISTAIESFKVRDDTDGYASSELKCLRPELKPMIGYAITVNVDSTTPASLEKRTVTEKFEEILDLIKNSPKPVVIVYKNVGPQRDKCCMVGDMVALGFSSIGAAGVVTDGCIRDLTGMKKNAENFQIFATGLVVSHGVPNILEIGNTVNICGLTIKPGDLLHGDESGLLKIPFEFIDIKELINRCEQILLHEKKYFDFMHSSKFSFEEMKKWFVSNPAAKDK